MAVYKRPGKSNFYWTRFTFDGREIRQSCKTKNKKDAEAFEAALRTQLALGRIGVEQLGNKAEKPVPFTAAMKDYLESLETKESTKRRYESASKALIAFFGNTVVGKIDTEAVERFRAWRKKQNKKAPAKVLIKNPKARLSAPIRPATVNRELMLLSGLFKRLVRLGKASENPVKDVSNLREENEQFRVVTDQEFRTYLMAASQPLRDVAVIMFGTGMRPEEVFNLTKGSINFDRGTIKIEKGKTKAARRTLTMSDAVRQVIHNRYEKAEGELLFPGGKKGDREVPIIKLTNAHNAAIDRVNEAYKKDPSKGIAIKPFRLYDLRHTLATHLTQSGVDLMTVKAILGHSRLEMVARYSHPTEQHQADAIKRLEAFRNPETNIREFRRTA